ncbi:MAG TPA: NAD-dependent DNA ligase LigA, partial [Paracoccaceae bacterium]|nr:NAD-dependent DNA ligase LigA [Paracoccaceae bacterium]
MSENTPVEALSKEQAKAELERLKSLIEAANRKYYSEDAPDISDAEYDALKQRNLAIEARFPDLKLAESPSEQIGAPVSETFSKIRHEVRMLSLGNAFSDSDVLDFD